MQELDKTQTWLLSQFLNIVTATDPTRAKGSRVPHAFLDKIILMPKKIREMKSIFESKILSL